MKKILIDIILNASAAFKTLGKLGKAFALTDKQAKRLTNQRDYIAYQQEANKPAWRSEVYRSRAEALKKEAALRMSLAEDLKLKEAAISKQYWETRQQYIQKERKLRQNLNAEEAKAARAEAARLNGQMRFLAMQRLNAKRERAAAAAYENDVYSKRVPALQRSDAMIGGLVGRRAGTPPSVSPALRMQMASAGMQRGSIMAWGGYANAMMGYYTIASALRQLDSGRKYEYTMKSVEAIAAGGKRQDELRKTIEQIGAETPLTTNEVAQVAEKLAKAGFDSRKMINSLPGLINLSLATDTKPGRGADYMAKTLAMFKLQSTQARKVSDYYTQAMLSAPTDMPELFTAMTYAGTNANKVGVSLRDSLAMLMALSNEGLVGSKAGTGLRNALTNLFATRGKPSIAMLDKYKIDRIDKKTGMQIPIETVLKQIAANVPKKDLFKFATQVFGKPGLGAGLILIEAARSGQLKENQKLLDEGAAGNVAARIAAQKSDTFEGDISKMESAIEGLQIAVFNTLLPNLREATQYITDITLKTVDWVRANPELVKQYAKIAAYGAGIFMAASSMVAVLGTIYLSVQAIVWVCSALKFGWVAVAGVIGGIPTFLLTMVALALIYSFNIDTINESLYDMGNYLMDNCETFKELVLWADWLIEKFEYITQYLWRGVKRTYLANTDTLTEEQKKEVTKAGDEYVKARIAEREASWADSTLLPDWIFYLDSSMGMYRAEAIKRREIQHKNIEAQVSGPYTRWWTDLRDPEAQAKAFTEQIGPVFADPKKTAEFEKQRRIQEQEATKAAIRVDHLSKTKDLDKDVKKEVKSREDAHKKAQNKAINDQNRENQARQQALLQASGYTLEDLHLKPFASPEETAKAIARRRDRIVNMQADGKDESHWRHLLPSNSPSNEAFQKLSLKDQNMMMGTYIPGLSDGMVNQAYRDNLLRLTDQFVGNEEIDMHPSIQTIWTEIKKTMEAQNQAQANKVASVDYSQMVASVSSASVAAKGVDVNVAAPSVVVNCDAKSIQGFTDEIMVALGPKIEAAAKSAASQIVTAQANNAARFRTAMA